MPYLDTSILAAYYCPERISRSVQRLLNEVDPPSISMLVEIEMHSAIAAKLRTGGLNRLAAEQVLETFRQHIGDGWYRFVAIGPREYSMACDWLRQFQTPLRAADALHLAAAATNGLTLLTADRNLAKSAKILGISRELIS